MTNFVKCIFDVIISFCALVILSPVILLLCVLVRWRLGSPVFFSQIRPGQNGKPFRMTKFRSMTNQKDVAGVLLPDEERLTSFGHFLRATSLDELPELWNVFKGDMSLVGPRPLLMEYLPRYTTKQARRHKVRPGITGWAQINGRNALSWEEKLALDVWYIENRSFYLDLKIILHTFQKVLMSEGITQAGHATTNEFMGSSSQEEK